MAQIAPLDRESRWLSIQWQLHCLQYRVGSLKSEIKRVADKDHPYPEPSVIFAALEAVLAEREAFLEDAIENYSVSDRKVRGLGNLEPIIQDLNTIGELFSLAHRVDSARIPFEILRSLSWASTAVLPGQSRAVVRLDPTYNYSITSFRERFADKDWLPFWDSAVSAANLPSGQTILLFGFPSPEVGSILVHGIAAHELGHLVAPRWESELEELLNRHLSSVKQRYRESISDFIAEQLRGHVQGSGISREDAYESMSRIVEFDIYSVAELWIREMFADFVAARLVGPAFIAAFDRVKLGFGRAGNTHPPGSWRRLQIRQFLKEKMPHVADDPVWRLLFSASAEAGFNELYHSIASEVCALSFEEIARLVEKVPSPIAVDPTQLRMQIEAMQEHIEHLSPPSVPLDVTGADEIDTANMFWLLLYAAWHFRFSEDRFTEFARRHGWQEDLAKAEAAIGNMVQHALESLELHFRWKLYTET